MMMTSQDGFASEQPAPRVGAVAPDPYGNARGGEDQRFVADNPRIIAGRHGTRHRVVPAVATTDDSRLESAARQLFGERTHERRLARASGGDIAHDDHGNRQPLRAQDAGANEEPPHRDDGAKQQRQRPQQRRQWRVTRGAYQVADRRVAKLTTARTSRASASRT